MLSYSSELNLYLPVTCKTLFTVYNFLTKESINMSICVHLVDEDSVIYGNIQTCYCDFSGFMYCCFVIMLQIYKLQEHALQMVVNG